MAFEPSREFRRVITFFSPDFQKSTIQDLFNVDMSETDANKRMRQSLGGEREKRGTDEPDPSVSCFTLLIGCEENFRAKTACLNQNLLILVEKLINIFLIS